jgi:predicted transcriptional regulator
MLNKLEGIRRDKIVCLSTIVTKLWNKEMYVGEIKEELGTSYQVTSKYLSLLKEAHIVKFTHSEKCVRGLE